MTTQPHKKASPVYLGKLPPELREEAKQQGLSYASYLRNIIINRPKK